MSENSLSSEAFDREEPLPEFDPEDPKKLFGSLHDGLFHYIMRQKPMAIDFLSAYLGDWTSALDLANLKVIASDHYDPELTKRVADLEYEIPYHDERLGELRVPIVVEHKAQSDRKSRKQTIANLMHYIVSATTEQLALDPIPTHTPQAIAVLAYTGADLDYKSPVWKEQFILPSALSRFSIECEIPHVNITALCAEDRLKGSPMLRTFCQVMARAGRRELRSKRKTLFQPINELMTLTEQTKRNIAACATYALKASSNIGEDFTDREFNDMVESVAAERTRNAMVAILERAKNDGIVIGRDEGITIGINQGINQGITIGINQAIDLGLKTQYPERADRLIAEVSKIQDPQRLPLLLELIFNSAPADEVEGQIERFAAETSSKRSL